MNKVELQEGFSQVCVWPGTLLGDTPVQEFVDFFKDEMNARIQYIGEAVTRVISDTEGGRVDQVFAVHTDDIGHFAIKRLPYGIKWVEDFLNNGEGSLFDRVDHELLSNYRTW